MQNPELTEVSYASLLKATLKKRKCTPLVKSHMYEKEVGEPWWYPLVEGELGTQKGQGDKDSQGKLPERERLHRALEICRGALESSASIGQCVR